MRYFVVSDNPELIHLTSVFVAQASDVIYLAHTGKTTVPRNWGVKPLNHISKLRKFKPETSDRVLVAFDNDDLEASALELIRAESKKIAVLALEQRAGKQPVYYEDPSFTRLNIANLVAPSLSLKYDQIDVKRNVQRLREAIDPTEKLYILTQDDPDPDAIASGMALRELVGRSEENSPIITLKPVSRSENINMITLLDANIEIITIDELKNLPQIAMVDVSPQYFQERFPGVVAVVDHHPQSGKLDIPFADIKVGYGATSTIFTEYLLAAEKPISQKLATALYYGIKTDTLMLGREVSRNDFDAFVKLWHFANHHHIHYMERPMLNPEEIGTFLKALSGHFIKERTLFVPLGKLPREDLVPRLADFAMQIGKTEFVLVWGEIGENTTFSARAMSRLIHAGELMKELFSHAGSAGGHQSMARATLETAKLLDEYPPDEPEGTAGRIAKKVLTGISEQKRNVFRS